MFSVWTEITFTWKFRVYFLSTKRFHWVVTKLSMYWQYSYHERILVILYCRSVVSLHEQYLPWTTPREKQGSHKVTAYLLILWKSRTLWPMLWRMSLYIDSLNYIYTIYTHYIYTIYISLSLANFCIRPTLIPKWYNTLGIQKIRSYFPLITS